MTPTQEQIRNMSDKDLVWRKKVIDSHVERLLKQQEWLAEEMERRSKDEQMTARAFPTRKRKVQIITMEFSQNGFNALVGSLMAMSQGRD